jgi:hypothetical protein
MTPAFKVRPPLTDSLLPPSQPIATFHHGDAQARHEDDSPKGNKLLSPPSLSLPQRMDAMRTHGPRTYPSLSGHTRRR